VGETLSLCQTAYSADVRQGTGKGFVDFYHRHLDLGVHSMYFLVHFEQEFTIVPTPRARLVDVFVTPWYHCISRCVRRAGLLGDVIAIDRKAWIERRLEEIVAIFAIDCAGFAVMDNHLHLLVRLDSTRAESWSSLEVARRWLRLFPIRDVEGRACEVSEVRVERLAGDREKIAVLRRRLSDLSWFMKCLKEPLARLANREDGCTGAFWEGRFRSVAVLDERSLLATAVYIDLNPVAAGIVSAPEQAEHTSLRTRLDHCRSNDTLTTLSEGLSTQTIEPAQEAGLWLMPVNDDRPYGGDRVGLLCDCTLSTYLQVVDATSRFVRDGRMRVDADEASLLKRLGIGEAAWERAIDRLFEPERRLSNRLRKASERVGGGVVDSRARTQAGP
jgi:REP element-mobilizing transposase RayT